MPRPIPTVSLRRALAWLSFILLLAVAAFILWQELRGPQAVPVAPSRVVAVAAAPLAAPAGTGALRLAGAVVLTSADADFGGLSGLAALPDGRLLAVSDAGQWLRFTPVLAGGRLAGVAGAEMGAIPALGATKQDRDTEAIAFTAAGETLVSLEQQHRILRFSGIGPPRRLAGTLWRTEAISWPSNGGGETLAALPDGALLWVAESARAGGGEARRALLIAADG
ncbi:esterase-like activity of phytase family protein, partial [Sandarakinorhabdus rubra]|uniref:esterase-like activity of phytase family protein n=1 Tax=Sandarakinorhabdus rubra TaxID=2672568 RepID=UPI0013DCE6FC